MKDACSPWRILGAPLSNESQIWRSTDLICRDWYVSYSFPGVHFQCDNTQHLFVQNASAAIWTHDLWLGARGIIHRESTRSYEAFKMSAPRADPAPTADYLAASKGPQILVFVIVFPALALMIVALRLYTRIHVVRKPSHEDFAITLAMVELLLDTLRS